MVAMTSPDTLLAALTKAANEYRQLLARTEAAKKTRDALISEAHARPDVKKVDIAKATGLTRERVRNIVK